ncbi:MAG TPA: hypothetical protein DCS23_01920 [Candidatus Yonathbacteria bacterium]|nr:hypothetical protein [Candidatus Yonathbacteria bacterium]
MISLTNLKKSVSNPASRLCERLRPRRELASSEAIQSQRASGFTLLELLIIVSIIAILSVALMYMLNPAEAIKKSRDVQRISDLSTIKAALGTMLVGTSTPSLDNSSNAVCYASGVNTTARIRYSTGLANTYISTDVGVDAAVSNFTSPSVITGFTKAGDISGGGWIPAVLSGITGGSPISNYPVDPVNTVVNGLAATSTDLVYRYACQNVTNISGKPAYTFEINAQLESSAYTVDDDKRENDGGDNDSYYEIGNSLKILPTGASF